MNRLWISAIRQHLDGIHYYVSESRGGAEKVLVCELFFHHQSYSSCKAFKLLGYLLSYIKDLL